MATTYATNNAEETISLGEKLAASLKSGDVVALCGGLGAGKTVFAKGVAKGLGVDEEVTSPTYTLLKQYMGSRLPLCHFDLYRIEDEQELEYIGFYDFLGGENVCLIEWAQNAGNINPNIKVQISGKGNDTRVIKIYEEKDAYTGG
ncbi:MAG: tRNA (adenosine(37)-N6)-threonylcarbamoyltransferase complex ATPase subunit type 1 TsaE [Christensenellales bacterium]